MTSVDDAQKILSDHWTILLWLDDVGFYRALAIDAAETTQHAMTQERQMGKGSQLSEAVCCLVEKMSGGRTATGTLLEVARGLIEWDD